MPDDLPEPPSTGAPRPASKPPRIPMAAMLGFAVTGFVIVFAVILFEHSAPLKPATTTAASRPPVAGSPAALSAARGVPPSLAAGTSPVTLEPAPRPASTATPSPGTRPTATRAAATAVTSPAAWATTAGSARSASATAPVAGPACGPGSTIGQYFQEHGLLPPC